MRTLRMLTAAAMVLGLGIAVFPSTAAAVTTVTTEAQLRAAFADPDVTEIILGADIDLGCGDDLREPYLLRDSGNDLAVRGAGHTIKQTCPNGRIMTSVGGGALTIDNATLTRGHALDESGGAIHAAGDVTVKHSTLTANTAADDGGAIYALGFVRVDDNSTLTANTAGGSGGAIFAVPEITVFNSTFGGNTAGQDGGAIRAETDLLITGSTLAGNRAGDSGGAISTENVGLTNSTVTGNHATGSGGGILASSRVIPTHTTVVANEAPNGANITIWMRDGLLSSHGSVIAMPAGGGKNCGTPDGTRSQHSFSDDTSCGLTDTTNTQNGGNPHLGELANNGGPTQTRMPAAASPLVDAISCRQDIRTDQRGVKRPQGEGCDIGAVEREVPVNHPPAADDQQVSTEQDTPVGITLTGSDPDGDTLSYAIDQQPSHGELTGEAPALTYTPSSGYTGADSFTFTVDDGNGATDTGTVSITVTPMAEPMLSVGDVSVLEGDAGTTQALFPVTLSHASEDTVFFEYKTNDGTAIAPEDYLDVHAVTHISEGETSTEVIVKVVGDTAVESDESFTLELVDSSLTSVGVDDGEGVGVILNDDEGTPPPNEPPVAEDASVQATQGRPESVKIEATDPEGEPLTYAVDVLPGHGQVTGDGPEFSYTADGDYTGADGFTVEVCDASGACDNAKVTISVAEYEPPSEPPTDAGELTVDPSKAKRGQDIEVSGSGFAPGEWVFLVLHSDPAWLGAVRADDNGSIATTVTVPTSAEPGEHLVAAYGEESALTGKLTVTDDKPVDPKDPKDPADPKDPRDPGGNGGSQGPGTPAKNAGDSGGKGLALTGSPVLPLLGAGLGMVLLGGLWMLAVRRLRRSPTLIEDLPRRSSS